MIRSVPNLGQSGSKVLHACWLILRNPGLVSLTFLSIPFLEYRAQSLAGWDLQVGDIGSRHPLQNPLLVGDMVTTVLLPLIFDPKGYHGFQGQLERLAEHVSAVKLSNDNWYREEAVAAVMERRQEPLVHLEDLSFRGMRGHWWVKTVDLAAMLAPCPNLKKFGAHLQIWDQALVVKVVVMLIVEACPRIEVVVYGPNWDQKQRVLTLRIMGALHAQRVVSVKLRVGPNCIGI